MWVVAGRPAPARCSSTRATYSAKCAEHALGPALAPRCPCTVPALALALVDRTQAVRPRADSFVPFSDHPSPDPHYSSTSISPTLLGALPPSYNPSTQPAVTCDCAHVFPPAHPPCCRCRWQLALFNGGVRSADVIATSDGVVATMAFRQLEALKTAPLTQQRAVAEKLNMLLARCTLIKNIADLQGCATDRVDLSHVNMVGVPMLAA